MKKILAILGTITISGSAMAGLVGNAPAPAKNNINYQQKNNLETLKRNKRQYGYDYGYDNNYNADNYYTNRNKKFIPAVLAVIGAAASVIGIVDSYKNNGAAKTIPKDLYDSQNN